MCVMIASRRRAATNRLMVTEPGTNSRELSIFRWQGAREALPGTHLAMRANVNSTGACGPASRTKGPWHQKPSVRYIRGEHQKHID
jgi:hypothetical protein